MIDDLDSDFDESAMRRKRLVPLIAFGLILLGLAGAGVWWFKFRVNTAPDRVVVAVYVTSGDSDEGYWWEGSTASETLSRNIAARLEESGFVPTTIDDEVKEAFADASSPEEIRAVAAKLGIGFVVLGNVTVDETIELRGIDFKDYRVRIALSVMDTEAGGEPVPVPEEKTTLLDGEAMGLALQGEAKWVSQRVLGPLAAVLVEQPRLAPFREPSDSFTIEQDLIQVKLEPLFRLAAAEATAHERRAEDLREAEQDDVGDASPATRELLGQYLDEEYFVGVSADGAELLWREPKYLDAKSDRFGYEIRTGGEQLEMITPSGREVVHSTYNFYSYMGLSKDGSTVVAVVDSHGWAKTLMKISIPEGEATPLLTLDGEYFSTPRPSPDGSKVVYYHQQTKRSPAGLEVFDLAANEPTRLMGAGNSLAIPAFSPDGSTLYLGVGDNGPERIMAIDVASGERTHLLGVAPLGDEGLVILGEDGDDPEDDGDGGSEDGGEDTDADDADSYDADGTLNLDDDDDLGEEDLDDEGEPLPPDPRLTSRFFRSDVGHDGTYLVVAEQPPFGPTYIGRYTLETREYVRLAEMPVSRVIVEPTGTYVAVETTGYEQAGDPAPYDTEVVLVELFPDLGQDAKIVPVTLNSTSDDLVGVGRDGKTVYVHQNSRDPDGKHWANRIYRYTLP